MSFDLENDVDDFLFSEWYDKTLETEMEGKQVINYSSYFKGLRYKDI